MQTHDTLAQQAARRTAVLESVTHSGLTGLGQDSELVKASGAGTDNSKALTAFDAPVLEHLRQCNMAAYENMLGDITADINNVLAQR